jgi:hypothetical protein
MSPRGVTLAPGSIVVLSLDGTLAYVEDVQPTYAAVVALPEQLPAHQATAVFTPGRVGPKKISPYSSSDRVVEVKDLSDRNRNFIGTFEQLRKQHGPNYIERTPEELEAAKQEAAVSVTKVHPTKSPRGAKKSPEERKQRRANKRAAKVPCVKCNLLPVHASHQNGGSCEYEAPVKKARGTSAPAGEKSFTLTNLDIAQLQADNDKFAQGNRYYRVFLALKNLPESMGTFTDVLRAVCLDAGKPMTNPEKVARRALKALTDAGNAQMV